MNERELIGDRLREERKKLGLNQDEAGTSPQVQRRYESGTSTPGADYLAAFAQQGADILYIVTGQRAVGAIADDEAAVLKAYRDASEPVRRAALAALLTGATSHTTIEGNVGNVVHGSATFGDFTVGGKAPKKKR
ncbi:MAG: helix-turn-helix transcriptional regulator [Moraxellaceae bacterium]|nr:helix-turn-helix transcriptional regulator [Moraxellaceae bacterium]